MHAAVVTSFDAAPEYREVPTPVPDSGQELVTVLASAVHPRVRSQAGGTHYTSTEELPLVPGIDGVGRTADGALRYFVLPDTTIGAMAEQTLIDPRRSVVLPDGVDPVLIAAAMNPAMSSWIAFRRRIDFRPGSRVLVMGATGNAGRMAVQIAKRLGAGHVTAAGRNPAALAQLPALGADRVVDLGRDASLVSADLAAVGRDVDVVLDYLWGDWAATALTAIVPARDDDSQPLTWIQIGSVTGPTAPIPSAALRAADLRIIGSGQGSVSPRDILAELPGLATEVSSGVYDIAARSVPLRDVTAAWTEDTNDRIVITPSR
ncbi:quinone oxidoreductase family protein [Curtobacterium sp. Leaf261]|uniref:quinone oxidoreductase family protein n=1 Tax=Curtobacterium sp. Leaf261 TaxID=1736311 RepID=UPI0006F8A8D3|nr:zinc-binding alcohol dehydrogenase family protein [Curtobacterium sp. Leaf261]KQO62703.1 quinone oxidoreductase [Curtobacterium sp. Leaf261]